MTTKPVEEKPPAMIVTSKEKLLKQIGDLPDGSVILEPLIGGYQVWAAHTPEQDRKISKKRRRPNLQFHPMLVFSPDVFKDPHDIRCFYQMRFIPVFVMSEENARENLTEGVLSLVARTTKQSMRKG